MEITKLGHRVDYKSNYDPTQLEFFPRSTRRVDYVAPMNGGDIWTCFEVSFLDSKGVPEYHILRILNPASSENIFESKSLKLYLNSFNNTKFSGIEEVIYLIQKDLSEGTKGQVLVRRVNQFDSPSGIIQFNIDSYSKKIESGVEYTYNPKLLKAEPSETKIRRIISSNLLRSNCEVTGQPDWGNVTVSYISGSLLDIVSFLRYIISFRNHQEFHEPTCERIYNDLFVLLQPEDLTVVCQYTRRGGIDINPIRTTMSLKEEDFYDFFSIPKLPQQ